MFDMRMHSDRDNPAERFDAPGNFTDQATKDQVRLAAPESSGVDPATRAIPKQVAKL